MTINEIHNERALDELRLAAERLNLIFAPLAGRAPCAAAIDRAETEARSAFGILYRHLHALAAAEIHIRARGTAGFALVASVYEMDEMAHMSAEIPFLRRTGDGLLEITGLTLRFFQGGEQDRREALFLYLKGIVVNSVRQVFKQMIKQELPVRYYVSNAVNRHVATSERYERRGTAVFDRRGGEAEQRATAEEIVALAAPFIARTDTPGRIVDLVFDRLRETERYRPAVDIALLRAAVFELVRGRYLLRPPQRAPNDPLQEHLESELLLLARETVERVAANYRWRDKPVALKAAYCRAGNEYLEDIISNGGGTPHHELLGRHLDGCDAETYRDKHMGGFQHFLGYVWSDFLKNFRAET